MFAPVRFVLSKAFASTMLKGWMWQRWYRYLNGVMGDRPIWFMNYGYMPESLEPMVELRPEDEPNRTCIQLYELITRAADLTGRDVLEVSCGRGGGARYLSTYRGPKRMVGLDRTPESIDFCTRQHQRAGLQYLCGDAMALRFPDASFDAVVNVEASHCYPDFPRFLQEVRRVLRPGGHFLYTDSRKQMRLESWRNDLASCGMTMLETENITEGVLRALDHTNERVSRMIRETAPRYLRPFAKEFAGTEDSTIYRWFKSGELHYVRYVFRKEADGSHSA
jgi:ubiquinone/menaquinone biosynthesis C-methylase UbiE